MTGRSFVLKDGVETANFRVFRQFWHFDRNEGVLEQIGWGGVCGVGAVSQDGGDKITDQMFYRADGSSARQGQRSRFPDAETHATDSFDIVDGEWRARRSYIWKTRSRKNEPPGGVRRAVLFAVRRGLERRGLIRRRRRCLRDGRTRRAFFSPVSGASRRPQSQASSAPRPQAPAHC